MVSTKILLKVRVLIGNWCQIVRCSFCRIIVGKKYLGLLGIPKQIKLLTHRGLLKQLSCCLVMEYLLDSKIFIREYYNYKICVCIVNLIVKINIQPTTKGDDYDDSTF